MTATLKFWAGLLLALCLAAPAAAAEGPIKIVATTTDLASLAQAVAGPLAQVRSICNGQEDPHFLQAKPSYILEARDADLWIRVGMELEVGWEVPVLEGARRGDLLPGQERHLDASEKVLRLEVPSGQISRAMGDVHPEGNPHYWLDPLNGRLVAAQIAERLARLYPQHAAQFSQNLVVFQRHLDEKVFGPELLARVGGEQLWSLLLKGQLDSYLVGMQPKVNLGGWLAKMQPLRGSRIITYHKSWSYLANRFGLVVSDELEPLPGIPPSSSHLAEVISRVKSQGVKFILIEPYYPRKAADFVAEQTGVKVVSVPNMVGGAPGAGDYLALLDLIINQVAGAL